MRALFWVLAVFAAAVALVILGRVGAGYVMFVYPPYRVELSLPFFVVASLAGFVLLYAAMRLLGHAVSLPTYVRAYRSRRRRERARSEEHTSELQSLAYLVCRLLLEKKNLHTPFAE